MKNEKTVDVLNKLVEINNDRIEGYETAAKETPEVELKTLFGRLARASHKAIQELSPEISRLGGTPTDGTKNSGKLFRAWMDVKAALISKDRKAILNSCEFGEDHALKTYENVLQNDREHLNASHISMINAQMAALRSDHDHVKAMRDALRQNA